MAIEIKETIKVESADAVKKTREMAAETEKLGKARKKANEKPVGGSGDDIGLTSQERNRLAENLKRVREAVDNYNRRNGITGDRAAQNQKEAAAAVVEEAQSKARGIGRTIADEMSRRSSGAIGKMVAGFVAHEGVSMMFAAARNPLGGNQGLEIAEGAVNGAIGGATSGAMVGGPVGAVVGGLLGTLSAVASKVIEQSHELERIADELSRSDRRARRSVGDSASDSAFGKLLSNMSHEGRISEMQDRYARMVDLKVKMDDQLTRKGVDPTSSEYRELTERRNELAGRISALERSISDERMNIPLGRMLDTASLTDSYAKKGLMVGAQVNIADVNTKILDKLREGVDSIKKISDGFASTDIPSLVSKVDAVAKSFGRLGGDTSHDAVSSSPLNYMAFMGAGSFGR